MAKAKSKPKTNNQLPRFTIQMLTPLYKTMHKAAIACDFHMYQLVNHLLILGLKEWVKTLPKELVKDVNLDRPDLEEAKALSAATIVAKK